MIHGCISLSGLISFLIVQRFANSAHPTLHAQSALKLSLKTSPAAVEHPKSGLDSSNLSQHGHWQFFSRSSLIFEGEVETNILPDGQKNMVDSDLKKSRFLLQI